MTDSVRGWLLEHLLAKQVELVDAENTADDLRQALRHQTEDCARQRNGLRLACELMECELSLAVHEELLDEKGQRLMAFARARIREAGGETTGPRPGREEGGE